MFGKLRKKVITLLRTQEFNPSMLIVNIGLHKTRYLTLHLLFFCQVLYDITMISCTTYSGFRAHHFRSHVPQYFLVLPFGGPPAVASLPDALVCPLHFTAPVG